jgi:hypothetical protein
MMDDIRARATEIAAATGTTIAFRELARAAPAVATPEVHSGDRTRRGDARPSARRGCRAAPATTRR